MWLAYLLCLRFSVLQVLLFTNKWVRDEGVNNVEQSAREKTLFEVQKNILWRWAYDWIITSTNEDVNDVGVEYLHQDKNGVWENNFKNAIYGWKMYISMSWMTKQLSDVQRPKFTVTNKKSENKKQRMMEEVRKFSLGKKGRRSWYWCILESRQIYRRKCFMQN